jgi:hypothetical protein
MSKEKKAAYAEKQKAAAVTQAAQSLAPVASNPGPAKKAKARKQSRGK